MPRSGHLWLHAPLLQGNHLTPRALPGVARGPHLGAGLGGLARGWQAAGARPAAVGTELVPN